MMTYKEIATMIQSIGYPYAYRSFEGGAPSLPYVVFLYPNNNDVSADNINYTTVVELDIELYTENKDFDAETRVEEVLTNHGIFYVKSSAYIDTERMYQTLYTTEIIINQ